MTEPECFDSLDRRDPFVKHHVGTLENMLLESGLDLFKAPWFAVNSAAGSGQKAERELLELILVFVDSMAFADGYSGPKPHPIAPRICAPLDLGRGPPQYRGGVADELGN